MRTNGTHNQATLQTNYRYIRRPRGFWWDYTKDIAHVAVDKVVEVWTTTGKRKVKRGVR